MRTKRTSQVSLFDPFAQHDIGRELAAMSAWLEAHLDVLDGRGREGFEGVLGKSHWATRDDRGIGPALCVAFHKKRGLCIEAMVKSLWVYRKLRNFRAGIEAGISCLKAPMD